jgi:hypothetical protein
LPVLPTSDPPSKTSSRPERSVVEGPPHLSLPLLLLFVIAMPLLPLPIHPQKSLLTLPALHP